MKKIAIYLVLTMFCAGFADAAMRLLVDEFNSGKMTNYLGGNTGCWNCNPRDKEQYCESKFDSENALENTGYSLNLKYNVTSSQTYDKDFPNIASNGYFTQLSNANLEGFKYLVFYIKGDKQQGFTRSLTLELKNMRQSSRYVLQGITGDWQRMAIPLSVFKDITDWSSMTEIVFTFNHTVTRKKGALYIDCIYFAIDPEPLKTNAIKIPKDKSIKIDGSLEDWDFVNSISLDPVSNLEAGDVKNPGDLSINASFAWDEKYLYFSARVLDDQIFCRETGQDIWKEDCVELYIDPTNKGFMWDDPQCYQLGFSPAGTDNKIQMWSWFQQLDPKDYISAASKIGEFDWDKGYQIEAAIEWGFLGLNPKKGKTISLSFAVHDLDYNDNTQAKLNWCYIPKEDKVLLGKLLLK